MVGAGPSLYGFRRGGMSLSSKVPTELSRDVVDRMSKLGEQAVDADESSGSSL
jgi:hypothetical protein